VRAIEEQSRAELSAVGGQIAHGVPLAAIRTAAPGRRLSFVRTDGRGGDAMVRRASAATSAAARAATGASPPDAMWSVVEMPLVSPADGRCMLSR